MRASAVLLATLLLAVCGCSTPDALMEQVNPPSTISNYALPSLASSRHVTSLAVDLTDCPEGPLLTKRGLSGVTHPVCPFPFRRIVAAECDKIVEGNFRRPRSGETPDGTLKVSAERVLLKRAGIRTSCDIELVFDLSWSSAVRQPLVHHYESRLASPFVSEQLVPDCVYHAVQDVCQQFLRDLSLKAAAAGGTQPNSSKW